MRTVCMLAIMLLAPGAQGQIYKWVDEKGQVQRDQAQAADEKKRAQREKACAAAREDLEYNQQGGRFYTTDDKGEKRFRTDDEQAAVVEAVRRKVAELCN